MRDFNEDQYYAPKFSPEQIDREIERQAGPVHVDVEPYNPVWGAVQSIKEHDE